MAARSCGRKMPNQPRCAYRPMQTTSLTVIGVPVGKTTDCMTKEMSCLTSLTGCPRTSMRPALGESMPATDCNNVVLPEPFGPMTAVILPRGIINVEAETARWEPRYNTISWASTRVMRLLAQLVSCCACVGQSQPLFLESCGLGRNQGWQPTPSMLRRPSPDDN